MCVAVSRCGVQVSLRLVNADVYVIIALSLNDLFTTDNNVKIIITICYPLISVLSIAILFKIRARSHRMLRSDYDGNKLANLQNPIKIWH